MLENIEITGRVSLLELRSLMQMTQEKFAEFVGIPITTYRRYEKDISSASFKTIVHICDRVGVSVDKIKA